MAYLMFSTKPVSETMLDYSYLVPWKNLDRNNNFPFENVVCKMTFSQYLYELHVLRHKYAPLSKRNIFLHNRHLIMKPTMFQLNHLPLATFTNMV